MNIMRPKAWHYWSGGMTGASRIKMMLIRLLAEAWGLSGYRGSDMALPETSAMRASGTPESSNTLRLEFARADERSQFE